MLSLLYPIASLLGIEVGELVERAKKNGILWGAIALCSAVAFVFLLVAAYTATLMWLGPIWAPLFLAGISTLIALAIYAVSRVTAEIAHRREVERRRAAETTALVTTAAVTALPMLLRSPLMKQVGIPLGGALAALFVLSKSGHKPDQKADG